MPNLQHHASLRQLLDMLVPHEGYTASALDAVSFMRANSALPRMPVLYQPGIVIVCSGRKRGFLGGRQYVYDARHYLVLALPLPFESETEASAAEPMLAVVVRIDMELAAELTLALGQAGAPQTQQGDDTSPSGIAATPMDTAMDDAVLRLCQVLAQPLEAAILGPGIVREIVFRVLRGPQGGAIRAALAQHSQFGRIGKALRRIHGNYTELLDVATLALAADMSMPAFHAGFKAVTGTTPMQYLKTTRLHKARLLLVQDGLNAASAAHRVGYASTTQFSREFTRLFGRSPLREAARMQHALMLHAPSDQAQASLSVPGEQPRRPG
ncbi:AraC family transcriptional regulator [Janthinobacterium sp. RB2R34]|uniref:AraC family transcriptional regulator n=1 Tax=Janthinobacterium sp. RB2R34 TaxID=3424193 RepID=UPI003F24EE17